MPFFPLQHFFKEVCDKFVKKDDLAETLENKIEITKCPECSHELNQHRKCAACELWWSSK